MAFRVGNRNEQSLLPKSIEKYIPKDDPVRAYDVLIEALNFSELGIEINDNKVGNSSYNPKTMLKLLVYAYSYGWRSSRKIERATYHNLSFIWLMGGLKPDHKTIANFRKNNKEALKKVLKQVARLCIKLGLIEGNTIFLDGSKFRGNSSINQTKSKESLERYLVKIDERVNELINLIDSSDDLEGESLVKMPDELIKTKNLKNKIKAALEELEKEKLKKINLTDYEAKNMSGRQGSHASYNPQIVVDEKHGLIINIDIVNNGNDINQFTKQIDKANEILLEPCKIACADAGYSYASDLKVILDKGIDVIVPSRNQVKHSTQKHKPFSKDKFKYNEEGDYYICPESKKLISHGKPDKYKYFVIEKAIYCQECKNFSECVKYKRNKRGKRIDHVKDEDTRNQLKKFYELESSQAIYKKRKEKVELPFGHIKRNLNGWLFLLRGIAGANAEMAINGTCFNTVRMINILGGVRPFIEKLRSIA